MVACFVCGERRRGFELLSVGCHGGESCGHLSAHDGGGPVDGLGPGTMGDGEEVVFHYLEGVEEGGVS